VVGIVKKEPIAPFRAAVLSQARDEGVIVPFVHEHEVGSFERFIEVQSFQRVTAAAEPRIGTPECRQGRFAVLGDEIADAPCVGGLVDVHRVPARYELAADPAQEVRVAVVPV
jgi:hypothetical protein